MELESGPFSSLWSHSVPPALFLGPDVSMCVSCAMYFTSCFLECPSGLFLVIISHHLLRPVVSDPSLPFSHSLLIYFHMICLTPPSDECELSLTTTQRFHFLDGNGSVPSEAQSIHVYLLFLRLHRHGESS